MAHSDFEIIKAEINEHQRRIRQSRIEFVETVTVTRKAIDESRSLIAEIDAILAMR